MKLQTRAAMEMCLLPFFFVVSAFLSLSCAEISGKVGVNYGQLGNNLPSPLKSIDLIKNTIKANRVKLYDANPQILKALQNTNLHVSVMVPNQLISAIAFNQTLADQWVKINILPFYPATMIRYLIVGNEVLSFPNTKNIWFNIVPAMRKLRYSLKSLEIHKVKVGTTIAMDVLKSSFPPSSGQFRSDVEITVMKPLLQFLNRTNSFFFLDVYPFFPWSAQPKAINLDYALFQSKNITYTDPTSNLTYTNLFDQMVDSIIFAMEKLGYGEVRVWIAETGWPSYGDIDQIGTNIFNAATYNRNVVKKLTSKPPIGTPARPGKVLPSFIFALFNENQKGGPGTERNFGLLYPNGTAVYEIDLTGKTPASEYKPLPPATNNEPYKGKIWCVVAKGANLTAVQAALSYACSQGNTICNRIQPGNACYKPNTLIKHANYAFSSYWAQFKSVGGTCDFNGLAAKVGKDPSYGSCMYPSVTLA